MRHIFATSITASIATSIAAAMLVLPDPAWGAEAMLQVDLGAGPVEGELIGRLTDTLERADIAVESELDTAERWSDVVLLDVDEAWDARFVASIPALNRGRNMYFEARFEDAIEVLAPWLDRVEADPTVLALHPDLVAPFADAVVALANAWDASGDPEQGDATLHRLAALAPALPLAAEQYAPAVRARWDAARAAATVAHVPFAGHVGDCAVAVSGTAIVDEALPWTGRETWARMRCSGRDGVLYRVDGDTVVLDALLDDALVVEQGSARLRPRAATGADDLAELGAAAATAIGVDSVVLVAVRPASRTTWPTIEWVRVSSDGQFRAARVPLDAGEAELAIAAEWLAGGGADDALSVWRPGEGWTPGTGDIWIPDVRRAGTWLTAGLATAGIGVATALELQRAADASALSRCASSRSCALSADLDVRRADLRGSRSSANIAWIGAGALTGAAVVTAILQSPAVRFRERAPRMTEASAAVGPRSITLRVRF